MIKLVLLLLPLLICYSVPTRATDYYAALWATVTPGISTGRNSDAGTVVGYRIGDWPTVGSVTIVNNLEELMVLMEGDPLTPHTLHLWKGTFDNASDYLRLDVVNTQRLSVVGQGDATVLDASGMTENYAVTVIGGSGMTFRDFRITGGLGAFSFRDSDISDGTKNPTGNTVDNVIMENQSGFGIRLLCSQDSLTNFTLKNSTVTDDNSDAEGIRFITLSDCNINDIKILKNTFTGLKVGIQFFSLEEDAGANNSSPYNVLIDGNTIKDTNGYGIVFSIRIALRYWNHLICKK